MADPDLELRGRGEGGQGGGGGFDMLALPAFLPFVIFLFIYPNKEGRAPPLDQSLLSFLSRYLQ